MADAVIQGVFHPILNFEMNRIKSKTEMSSLHSNLGIFNKPAISAWNAKMI